MVPSFCSVLIPLITLIFYIIMNNISINISISEMFGEAEREIDNCILILMNKIFSTAKVVNLIYDVNYKFNINFFHDLNSNFTFFLLNDVSSHSVLNHIVISNELFNLYNIFEKLHSNHFSSYLIITQLIQNELLDFTKYLRLHNFIYVIFLIIDDEQKKITIHQYESNCGNCNNDNLELSLIGYCASDFSTNIQIYGSVRPFTEVLCPINFCKLKFIRVDYGATREELYDLSENGTQMAADSYGGCVLETFAEFNNISIVREDYVSNYNWYNAVDALNTGSVNIIFGPTLPHGHLVSHLEKGSAYTYEEFLFIDAIPKVVPTLTSLIMPLGIEVWICFTVIAFLNCVFMKLFKNFHKKYLTYYEKLNCLHLVAIHLNQYIYPPKKSGLRIVISMWLIYALLLNAIYNCNFISTLINIKANNFLTSFDELRYSGRRFGGPDVAKEWLYDPKDSIMMDLYNRYEIINPDNISHALYDLKMIVAQTDYVIFKTGMLDSYVLQEKIVSYPLLYYSLNGHPFLTHISRFMEKIRAGNIPLRNCPIKIKEIPTNEFNTVTMTHLQTIFKILLIGHLISIILFIDELLTLI